MFQHFTFKPLLSKILRKDYQFSFYFQGTQYRGLYYYNGQIEWQDPVPAEQDRGNLESQVQELMLYHVYDL